ncbi:MAG: transporter, family, multidrug resistance protein [Fimbriimonadaceae bacterium]|nr:transporter, family, multidrug resistance protein [Fimbriimonadaceae bacterium]
MTATDPSQHPPRIRIAELPILLALFLDLAAFGMVFPAVQLHARELGANGPVIGFLLASMFLVQMVASPPWGIASDRVGRKPVFLFCTSLSAISWVVYGLSTNLWIILVSRILAGLAAANVVVAQAYLADITPEDQRGAAMGRAGAAISGGLILGPAVGMHIVQRYGTPTLGFIAATCSGLAVLCGLFMAKPVRIEAQRPGSRFGFDFSLVKDNAQLRPLVLLATIAWFALATLEGTFGRLITEHYRLPQSIFGDIFSMESLIGAIVQGVILGWVVSKLGERWTLRVGFFLVGFGLLLTPFAPLVWLLFLFSALYSIGSALSNPTLNSAASLLVPENRQGELFGLLQGTRSVGFLIGPALGGALFDWRPQAPYLLAGTVGLVASLLVPNLASRPSANRLEEPAPGLSTQQQ